jgi:hypothetical protein
LQTFREEERLESLALGQAGFQPEAGSVEGDFLGKVEDGFYVQLLGPLGVLVQLCQGLRNLESFIHSSVPDPMVCYRGFRNLESSAESKRST